MSTQDLNRRKTAARTHPRTLFRHSKLVRTGILFGFVGPLLAILHFAFAKENLIGQMWLGSIFLGLALISGGCIKINARARTQLKIYISPSRSGLDESTNYRSVLMWNLLLLTFAISGLIFALVGQWNTWNSLAAQGAIR